MAFFEGDEVQILPDIPFSMIITGSSMSGKSTFVNKLLFNWQDNFPQDQIRRIVLLHKYSDQPVYTELKEHFGEDKLVMTNSLTEELLSTEVLGEPEEGTCIFIVDDVLHEISKNPLLTQLIIGGTHHLRIVTLIVGHNLYAHKHPNWITVARNATMLALFKQPRDMQILSNLNRQLFPGKGRGNYVTEAFNMALKDQLKHNNNKFGYLLIDCSIDCNQRYRLRTGMGVDEAKFCYVTPD